MQYKMNFLFAKNDEFSFAEDMKNFSNIKDAFVRVIREDKFSFKTWQNEMNEQIKSFFFAMEI